MKWASLTALAVLSSAMLAEDNMPQWTVAATDAVAAFAADNTHANPRADASGKGTWARGVEIANGADEPQHDGRSRHALLLSDLHWPRSDESMQICRRGAATVPQMCRRSAA